MKYIKLGQSELSIPVIGQGADIGQTHSCEYSIRYAFDQGCTFIDTAEIYGEGESERIIGKSIKGIRDQVVIATKVLSENLKYGDVIKSAEASLKRLDVDCIDLYQAHWPNSTVPISETMEAFEKLYDDGKIKYVGISNFLPMEIDSANPQEYSFEKFVSNQMEHSLFDRFCEKFDVPYCKTHGMTAICYCPLARGKFCASTHRSLLDRMAKKYEKTPSQIALNCLVSQGDTVVIPFSKNRKHILENVTSADFEMSSEDYDLIDKTVISDVIYVNTDSIHVTNEKMGTFSHLSGKAYRTTSEALENKLNFRPSPSDLSELFINASEEEILMTKPIRAIRHNGGYKITEGRIRYWGWVLAFGTSKKIPLHIVD